MGKQRKIRFESVSFFGLGYVGLPTAAVFADAGIKVIGVDINEKAVDSINRGQPHIVEARLDQLLEKVIKSGLMHATCTPEKSDVYVIAVPTPFMGDHKPDISFIRSAVRMITPLLEPGNLVILESTSPVGTTENIAEWIKEDRPDLRLPLDEFDQHDIYLAHCPERILPGNVIHEVVNNDRIIGGMTPDCSQAAVDFYNIAIRGKCHTTTARTAELCKLSENAFRDVNIAFANELSLICDSLDVDVWQLISLANRHPRVNILQPGPGVGGHCIAVDPWFIVDSVPDDAVLIATSRKINDAKPMWVADQVRNLVEHLEEPTIACMGLAYKPDVDDLRESPSITVVQQLIASKTGKIRVCEPFIDALPSTLEGLDVELVDMKTAAECDTIVFLTGHQQFNEIPKEKLAEKLIFDSCGFLKHQ